MSATLANREPYRFSAGVLALAVHIAFFSLLYFGVRWQSQPTKEFMVEMWDSLPNAAVAPEQEPPPPAKMEPIPPPKVVAPVLPPVKADIEIRDKKSKKVAVKEKPSKKDEAKEKAAAKARQEAERKELEAYSDRIRKNEQERVQTEQARVRAEVSTATRVQVERYQDLIRSKIRRKMKAVSDVPDSADAIFKITLLPDGTVMDVELQKSSGFPAYDNAAERAIRLADPLPMPADVTLQMMFRELKLSIRP
jgi:colicin import membrane protein